MHPFSKSGLAKIRIRRKPKDKAGHFSRYNYFRLVVILLFIVFLIVYKKSSSPDVRGNLAVSPNVNQAAIDTLASTFPRYVPLAGKLNILQSYDASYPHNPVKQSNVVFKSSKSSASLIDFYSEWADSNEWEVTNKSMTDSSYFLYLQKDKESMNITINRSEVSISYLQRP